MSAHAHLSHVLHLPQVVSQDCVISHPLPLNAHSIKLAQPLQEDGVVLRGMRTSFPYARRGETVKEKPRWVPVCPSASSGLLLLLLPADLRQSAAAALSPTLEPTLDSALNPAESAPGARLRDRQGKAPCSCSSSCSRQTAGTDARPHRTAPCQNPGVSLASQTPQDSKAPKTPSTHLAVKSYVAAGPALPHQLHQLRVQRVLQCCVCTHARTPRQRLCRQARADRYEQLVSQSVRQAVGQSFSVRQSGSQAGRGADAHECSRRSTYGL